MKTNTHINTLIGVGADAMANMYEVELYPPFALDEGDQTNLTVRATGFTPPTENHINYKVHWKSISWDKPSAKIDLERTFDITFRLDSYYEAYRVLKGWKDLTSSAAKSYANNDLGDDQWRTGRVKVKVLAGDHAAPPIGGGEVPNDPFDVSAPGSTVGWEFEQVWISSITPPTYAPEATEPATITATFRFGDFKDPFFDHA